VEVTNSVSNNGSQSDSSMLITPEGFQRDCLIGLDSSYSSRNESAQLGALTDEN
jgi:hypothetical protein